MAAITFANVTDISSQEVGTKSGKLVALERRIKITLSAQGGTAGDIPASALGMSEIFSTSNATLDASGTYTARTIGISPTGSYLFPGALADGAPNNVTGDLYVTVRGR